MIFISYLFTSCQGDGAGSAEVQTALGDAFETKPTASGQVKNGQCFEDQYGVVADHIIRKIDILIVPDTSGSIVNERADIAAGFENFLTNLPVEVDFRIGVVLAHSNSSSKSGKLYKKGSEPLVLDSELMTRQDIISALVLKMQNPATDNASDGGEMGMYSLSEAITTNLSEIQSQGFLRDDAALAVIFVADEQDICAKFPEGVIGVVDPEGKETSALNNICKDSNGDYIYTPERTITELENLKGSMPLVIGGVIYNNLATIKHEGENEIGYGYKEIIELSSGISIDLASGDYEPGLSNLGKLAQVSVKPESDFQLSSLKVNTTTIEVLVNGIAAPYTYNSEINQVHLTNSRDPFSTVRINYCEKEETKLESMKLIAGGFHTCHITPENKMRCFGRNNKGQLGIGSVENIGDDEAPNSIGYLDLGEDIIDASAGLYHTCALLKSGTVKCFGDNSKGQLGLGHIDDIGDNEDTTNIDSVPLPVPAIKIYSGTNYNCALLNNKKVKCWGENNYGQLGYGHTNNLGDDEDVSSYGYVSIGADVIQMDISTISLHTCAVTTTDDLKCWGLNSQGQLGYGHTNNLGDDELPSSYGYVSFGNKVLQIATGYVHTCALSEGQKVKCFGNNNNGQSGHALGENIGDNEAVDSIGYLDFSNSGSLMVATGNGHTCVLGIDQSLYCFGLANLGQTGLGHKNKIGDDEVANALNSKVKIDIALSQVVTGFNHTCALTKDEGKTICFGHNSSGQLGLNSISNIGDDEIPWEFSKLEEESVN